MRKRRIKDLVRHKDVVHDKSIAGSIMKTFGIKETKTERAKAHRQAVKANRQGILKKRIYL